VGLHDNFFELGGDSIITIQVVSRARREGYVLQPKDLFTHQTISQLASLISSCENVSVAGEQGLLAGSSGMLPVQQWYFEGNSSGLSHFNQSVLLEISKKVEPAMLDAVINRLLDHHDALRFMYRQADAGWHQEYGTYHSMVHTEDMRHCATDHLAQTIEQKSNQYQASLDIEKGDLFRMVLMQTPSQQTNNRLLIIVHHLAIDGVSWRILLDDLLLLLTGIVKREDVSLPAKGTSYRQWYTALGKYGQSRSLIAQKEYWQKVIAEYKPLTPDLFYNGVVTNSDICVCTVRLSTAFTQSLLSEVSKVYNTEINDLLLSAFAKAVMQWTGSHKVVIGLEGHGREDVIPGIDVSNTVGWFTSMYPVLLSSSAVLINPGDWIRSVKEQLRKVPQKGIGYGILKYINDANDLQGTSQWDIVFNYLGQADNITNKNDWFKIAGESSGQIIDKSNTSHAKIEINGIILNGELEFHCSYSSKHFAPATIDKLVKDYLSTLETFIHHCLGSESVSTPSDFGLGAEVALEELDRFFDTQTGSIDIMEF
jgi:non-ribosomal peptide synthase protein (TIGR01720 family)